MRREPSSDRRTLVLGGAAALGLSRAALAAPVYDTAGQTSLGKGARFGWATLDLHTGHMVGVNDTLRLPMCSTFKWLAVADVLARVDAGHERLERRIGFGPADLLDYAPITREALKAQGGLHAELSLAELCAAAVELSDNTAANLILAEIGGPAGLTGWLRSIDDKVTRLDRTEPTLNTAIDGDPRDTTTAEAMIGDLKRILYGPVLKPASRAQLLAWMTACKTGGDMLKAGLPAGWSLAHKTGDGRNSAKGDVGVLIPPTGSPILIAVYTMGSTRPAADIARFFAFIAHSTAVDTESYRTSAHG